jgi:hypothetical protein
MQNAASGLPPTGGATLSLAAALSQLGHHCPMHCTAVNELNSFVRFIIRAPGIAPGLHRLLVVIDCAQPVPHANALIRKVNNCARRDCIRVCVRSMSDRGRALDAVTHPFEGAA